MTDDVDLVHEQLDADGRWQRSFWSPERQRAYEAGQADAGGGGTPARLADPSWQTSAAVASAYWLGHLNGSEGFEALPDDVGDLLELARYLHREAAWTAAKAAHDDTGRPADLQALTTITAAMVYEQAARFVDRIIVGHPDDAHALWAPDADEDAADGSGGEMTLTLAADPSGEGVRVRLRHDGFGMERCFPTWWEAHTALTGLLHALASAELPKDP